VQRRKEEIGTADPGHQTVSVGLGSIHAFLLCSANPKNCAFPAKFFLCSFCALARCSGTSHALLIRAISAPIPFIPRPSFEQKETKLTKV
jgi:hypothetical protein